ncbi:unnamed protein product [Darwinula stevensoni]|uniref:TOG domain-containing protein n=1 Tax=Darwinula stevensoni TaxID=69355 RepID=A0A7R9FN09_9CRUS|nr:unnamed protein product [Darwinula stevensoni]CAG0896147.1 unnamed protein product [Darwinula stevensoni]
MNANHSQLLAEEAKCDRIDKGWMLNLTSGPIQGFYDGFTHPNGSAGATDAPVRENAAPALKAPVNGDGEELVVTFPTSMDEINLGNVKENSDNAEVTAPASDPTAASHGGPKSDSNNGLLIRESTCVDNEVAIEKTDPEILSKLPKVFQEMYEDKKWQDRKEALDIIQPLVSNPKLEAHNYGDLVKQLIKVVRRDANVVVVAQAVQCLTELANGLKRSFHPYATLCISIFLEKFKERKPNVVMVLREAVDTISRTASMESLQKGILIALESKNPAVKAETAAFLTRAFSSCPPASLTRKLLRGYCASLLKALNDSDATVRDNAAQALGTLLKAGGEKLITPFLANVDGVKMVKIKEYYEKAEVKVPLPKPEARYSAGETEAQPISENNASGGPIVRKQTAAESWLMSAHAKAPPGATEAIKGSTAEEEVCMEPLGPQLIAGSEEQLPSKSQVERGNDEESIEIGGEPKNARTYLSLLHVHIDVAGISFQSTASIPLSHIGSELYPAPEGPGCPHTTHIGVDENYTTETRSAQEEPLPTLNGSSLGLSSGEEMPEKDKGTQLMQTELDGEKPCIFPPLQMISSGSPSEPALGSRTDTTSALVSIMSQISSPHLTTCLEVIAQVIETLKQMQEPLTDPLFSELVILMNLKMKLTYDSFSSLNSNKEEAMMIFHNLIFLCLAVSLPLHACLFTLSHFARAPVISPKQLSERQAFLEIPRDPLKELLRLHLIMLTDPNLSDLPQYDKFSDDLNWALTSVLSNADLTQMMCACISLIRESIGNRLHFGSIEPREFLKHLMVLCLRVCKQLPSKIHILQLKPLFDEIHAFCKGHSVASLSSETAVMGYVPEQTVRTVLYSIIKLKTKASLQLIQENPEYHESCLATDTLRYCSTIMREREEGDVTNSKLPILARKKNTKSFSKIANGEETKDLGQLHLHHFAAFPHSSFGSKHQQADGSQKDQPRMLSSSFDGSHSSLEAPREMASGRGQGGTRLLHPTNSVSIPTRSGSRRPNGTGAHGPGSHPDVAAVGTRVGLEPIGFNANDGPSRRAKTRTVSSDGSFSVIRKYSLRS